MLPLESKADEAFDSLVAVEKGPASPANAAGALKGCCARLYELPITTLLLGTSFHPGGPALTRRLAQAAVIGRQNRVLDVASGTGESARVVAVHHGCEVVGVDYSAANVQRAAALTNEAKLSHRVSFLHGDAEELPLGDAQFDVVMCECALCTFPDMSQALAEMARVLRPRGRVAISDVVLNAPVPTPLDNVMGHVLCIRGALSAKGYVEVLEQAGFVSVRHRDASDVLHGMLQDIERRVVRLRALAQAGELVLPAGMEDADETLAAARDFVMAGGAGYGLFTGRRPA